MKKFAVTLAFLASSMMFLLSPAVAGATGLTSETFNGTATTANTWISGGSGGSVACLTAATTSVVNSIPACSGGPYDSVGNGVLQLTPDTGARSGFAFYNTPLSTSQGLQIQFNMYQYGGNGADGISFFLINGSANPTMPGAPGGGLGYSRNSSGTAGIVGGYVGIGFDNYGNFSNSSYGSGGPGKEPNNIVVRGSEASDYKYITGVAAAGSLENTTRANSGLPVDVTISSANIMSVAVNYGSGYVTELSDINLNTINGAGSLPLSFKFGFAASTGGSYDTHEISGLSVNTDPPDVSTTLSHTGNFTQGTTGQFTIGVSNNASAEATTGTTTISDTLPTGLVPTSATGSGWSCNISGQNLTCSTANVIEPGSAAGNITLNTAVLTNAATPLTNTVSVSTPTNGNPTPTASNQVTVIAGQSDGIPDSIKNAAPNNGDANDDTIPDSDQNNVSSFVDPLTNKYGVLDTTSNPNCSGNSNVSIDTSASQLDNDAGYSYPAGLMNFTLHCTPGSTATVVMYYYGLTDTSNLVLRKYNSITNTYSTISGASFNNVVIGGQQATKITYQITDNGPLDENSTLGTIVDPAGPALSVITPDTGYGKPRGGNPIITLIAGLSVIAVGACLLFTYRNGEKT
jgi:hypothetical protein